MTWLSQYFLHPGFVLPWGAALVAAPIVIHLLNRRKFLELAEVEFRRHQRYGHPLAVIIADLDQALEACSA